MTLVGLGVVAYLILKSDSETYVPAPAATVIITHDVTHKMIQLIQPALVQKLGGKCTVYPLETNYIRQDGEVFHCRLMFTVMDPRAYTYVTAVDADVTVPGATNFNEAFVSSVSLQGTDSVDSFTPFGEFETGSKLKDETLPTKAQLQAAFALA